MNQIFDYRLFDNPVSQWLLASGTAALAVAGLFLLRRLLTQYVTQIIARTAPTWKRTAEVVLQRTHGLLLVVVGLLAGSQMLTLSELLRKSFLRVVVVALLIQGGLWAVALVSSFVDRYREQKLKVDPSSVTTVQVTGFLASIAVWILVGLLILANLDIEITPLLAGLGVGGIAVALAVQTVLKDLLASISILLDKPFVIGDFLILGELMGSVEYIGLKTTRLRSLSGEQLILSNNDLLESRIRNFGRMRERRVVFSIGVTYQTPRDKLVKIPKIIREAIESQKLTRFDRSHFKAYGDFSLVFETVLYVGVPDFVTYMDIQQAVNLRIHEVFEQEGIEFAYPTQTVFLAPPGPTSGTIAERSPLAADHRSRSANAT